LLCRDRQAGGETMMRYAGRGVAGKRAVGGSLMDLGCDVNDRSMVGPMRSAVREVAGQRFRPAFSPDCTHAPLVFPDGSGV
jgi:hypothetical protein